MKYLILLLLLPFGTIAQGNFEATKISSGKITTIAEGKRVKIRTSDGERHYGRITFLDDQTLVIRKDTLQLDNITMIQKRSAIKGIGTAAMIGFGGLLVCFSPLLALAGPGAGAVAMLVTGTTITTTGIILPSLAQKHIRKRWNYKINIQ